MDNLSKNNEELYLKNEINVFSKRFFSVAFFSDNPLKMAEIHSNLRDKILKQFRLYTKEQCNWAFTEHAHIFETLKSLKREMDELSLFLLSVFISLLEEYDLRVEQRLDRISLRGLGLLEFYFQATRKWVSDFLRKMLLRQQQVRVDLNVFDFSGNLENDRLFDEKVFRNVTCGALPDLVDEVEFDSDILESAKSPLEGQSGIFGDYDEDELGGAFENSLRAVFQSPNGRFKIRFLKIIINNKNIKFLQSLEDEDLSLIARNVNKLEMNSINAKYLTKLLSPENSAKPKADLFLSLFKVVMLNSVRFDRR